MFQACPHIDLHTLAVCTPAGLHELDWNPIPKGQKLNLTLFFASYKKQRELHFSLHRQCLKKQLA